MITTFTEVATRLLQSMIDRAGVREWENETARDAMTATAMQMAVDICGYTEDEMATNFYYVTGTPVIFGGAGGSEIAWSMENIANNAGRQSVLADQGADGTARPHHWRYRIYYQCQATPTVGQQIRNLLKTSDGSHPDNSDSGNVAVSSINKLLNLFELNSAKIDQAAANIESVAVGTIIIPARYFGIVGWNTSGATTKNDTAACKAVFTPYYLQAQ